MIIIMMMMIHTHTHTRQYTPQKKRKIFFSFLTFFRLLFLLLIFCLFLSRSSASFLRSPSEQMRNCDVQRENTEWICCAAAAAAEAALAKQLAECVRDRKSAFEWKVWKSAAAAATTAERKELKNEKKTVVYPGCVKA